MVKETSMKNIGWISSYHIDDGRTDNKSAPGIDKCNDSPTL
jgi:hypothetical protein